MFCLNTCAILCHIVFLEANPQESPHHESAPGAVFYVKTAGQLQIKTEGTEKIGSMSRNVRSHI